MTKQRFTMPVERAVAQLALLGCNVKEWHEDKVILYSQLPWSSRHLVVERTLHIRDGRVKPGAFHRLRQRILGALNPPPNQGTTQP